MTRSARRLAALGALIGLVAAVLAPPPAAAAEPVFGEPSAELRLGEPAVFSTTLSGDTAPERVELLLRFPRQRAEHVLAATVAGGDGTWTATATLPGHLVPNTSITYRFRARDAAGGSVTAAETTAVVTDDRFDWRTVSGPIVRLHWYNGGDDFGQRALDIGERAVAEAGELLGVTETEPIDFFIYADGAAFREALGPRTRENVGGQAHADIRTMFGLILPSEINQSWVDVLVAHELTHLVFNTATENVYRRAPHWLNEGTAVYLSEGYSEIWRAALREGIARNALIPLDGLGARFAAGDFRFRLGYAEGVSAVDFFVETHGEPTLWQLVRSYAEGLSDDDAFIRATGADLATFNEAWMRSLGVEVPPLTGPMPGPTGPVPPGWAIGAAPTPAPTATATGPSGVPTQGPTSAPTAGETGSPVVPTPAPTNPPAGLPPAGDGSLLLVTAVGVAAAGAVLIGAGLLWRSRRRGGGPPGRPTA